MSKCGACDQPGVYGWQRWATPAEVQAWASDPSKLSVQAHETTAKVAVFACDDHVLRHPPTELDEVGAVNLDLIAITHGSDCSAPPTCNCQ